LSDRVLAEIIPQNAVAGRKRFLHPDFVRSLLVRQDISAAAD
jgi:hypothetical protein